MITNAILQFFMLPINGLLNLLPDFTIDIGVTAINTIVKYIKVGCYLLPMDTILTMLTITIFLIGFRIAMSLIKTIWNFIPFV